MKKYILYIFLLFIQNQPLLAQCSMCKSNAESSLHEGSGAARGLNDGISYLLLVPYMAAAAVGIAFLYHYFKKKQSNVR